MCMCLSTEVGKDIFYKIFKCKCHVYVIGNS